MIITTETTQDNEQNKLPLEFPVHKLGQPVVEHTINKNGETITQKQYPPLNGKTWIVVAICIICQSVFALAFLAIMTLNYMMGLHMSDLSIGFIWAFTLIFFTAGISLSFSMISKKPKLVSLSDFRFKK